MTATTNVEGVTAQGAALTHGGLAGRAWSLSAGLAAAAVILLGSLIVIGYLAVRRTRLPLWHRIIVLGGEYRYRDAHRLPDTRLLEEAALRDGLTPTYARQQSLIAVSCLRGLLLQRLLTPDAEIDAAAERFIASLATHPA